MRTFLDDPETKLPVSATTVDADHGRIETRTSTVSTDIAWLQDDHNWPGLAAIGKVVRVREGSAGTLIEGINSMVDSGLSASEPGRVGACRIRGTADPSSAQSGKPTPACDQRRRQRLFRPVR